MLYDKNALYRDIFSLIFFLLIRSINKNYNIQCYQ